MPMYSLVSIELLCKIKRGTPDQPGFVIRMWDDHCSIVDTCNKITEQKIPRFGYHFGTFWYIECPCDNLTLYLALRILVYACKTFTHMSTCIIVPVVL